MPNYQDNLINIIKEQDLSHDSTTARIADLALEYDVVDKFTQKTFNANATLETKQKLIQEKGLNKSLSLDGYIDGYAIGSPDTDGLIIEGLDGTVSEGRLYSALTPYLDGVETERFKIDNNKNKTILQYKLLSEILNKPIDQITDFDIVNYSNYSQQEGLINQLRAKNYGTREDGTNKTSGWLGELQRPDGSVSTELSTTVNVDNRDITIPLLVPTLTEEEVTYLLNDNQPTKEILDKAIDHAIQRIQNGKSPYRQEIEPYNPNITYANGMQEGERIPIKYKVVGKDYYGRDLIEVVNPNTGKHVTTDFGKNPYLNANLNVYEVLDSIPARRRTLEDITENQKHLYERTQDLLDSDNRILEDIDLIQSSFLQAGANILTLFNREFLGKPIDALDRVLADNGLPTVAELTDPETGKIVADSITGVKSSTREAYNKGMSEALSEWKEGNYLNALYKAVGQVDRILAESSPQMIAMSASAALKGIHATSMLLLAAADQTARNAIEYKHNNGTEWSAEQYALDFALNAALLVPERLLIMFGFGKLLKPSLNKIFKHIPDDSNIFSAVKAMATSVGGEALQEYAQGVEQAYMTQNQINKKSLLEVAIEPEQVFGGAVGGLVAGTITSVPVSVTSTVNGLIGYKNKKATTKENARKSEVTITNTDADKDLSATTIDKVNNIQVANYDPKTLTEVYKILDKMSASSELSEAAIETIARKKVEIETTGILVSDEVANNIKNKEETLERIIYYSDPNTEAKREDLDAIGEKLGFSKDKVRQKVKESKDTHKVEYEAKYGSIGYITIRDVISGIDSTIAEDATSLSEEEKASLLEKKDKLVAGLKNRYFNSQINKLSTIAEAIPDLRLQRKVYYGENNYINIKDVLNNDIGSGIGIYATIDGAIRNIKGINQTLKSLGLEENSLDNFNKVMTKLKNNINSLRVESVTPVKDVVSDAKAVFRGVTKAVKTSIEEGNDTALRKAFRTYGIEGLKSTSARLKEIDATKYKNLINKLDDAINKVETAIKNKNSDVVSSSTEKPVENIASTKEIETKVESLPSKDATSSEKPKLGSTKKNTVKSTKIASIITRIKELGGINPKSVVDAGYSIKEFKEDFNFSILNSKSKNSIDEIAQILIDEGTLPINDSSVNVIDHFLKSLKQNTESRKGKSIEEMEEEYYRSIEEKEEYYKDNEETKKSVDNEEQQNEDVDTKVTTESKLDKVKNFIKTFKDVVSPLFIDMDESPINEKLEKISELQRNIDTLQDTRKELQDNILSTRESIDSINVLIQTAKTKEERRIYLETKKEANDLLKDLYKEQKKLYSNKVRKLELDLQNIYKQIPNTAIVQRLEQIPLGDIVEATKVPNTVFGFSTINPKFILPNGTKVFDIVKDIYNAIDSSRFDIKKESPALQLLFTDKLNPNKNNKTGDHIPNTNLAVAIDYSVKEFILHNLDMLNPFTDDDMKRAFGLDEFKSLPVAYRTLAYEGGTYRVIIADMLGQAIADNLGIKPKSTTSQIDYKTFISNLGSYALVYAEYKGLIETSRWVGSFNENKNKSTFRRFGDNEKSTSILRPFHMVKAKVTSEQLNEIKADYEALAPYRISNSFDRMPLPNPKYRETTEIQDKYFKREANSSVHEAVTKLEKIPHVINYELVKYIEDNIEVVKNYLGYSEDTEVSYYTSESQKAINRQILQQLNSIIDLSKKDHSEWFLPYSFVVNGRYMVDTTAVNPMQDSDIARWLFVPKGREVTISLDNEQDMSNFRYAIAQAFGYGVDKKSTTSREEFVEKILSLDAVTLKSEILKHKDKKSLENSLGFGFEHFGQLLVGIQALEAYQTAKNLGNKSFTVSLSAEFDSTTSAYFIKQLLFPTPNLAKYNEKVGIFDGVEKDFHNVKAEEGFFDIYQTSAKALKLVDKKALDKKLKSRNSKNDLLSQDKKFTLVIYSLLYDTLPKVAEGSTEVSSELRTLLKSPNMVFGYGAGKQSLANNLGFKLTTSLIDRYVGNKADKAEQRVFEGIRSKLVVPMDKKEFITALKESPLESIKIKLGDTTTSVEQFLVTLLSDTYGNSVYDTLFQEFKDYVDIGFFMNSAFSIMFDNWKIKFDDAVEKIESKLKRKLSIEEENRVIAKSLEFLPIIPSPYSDILEEGIAILDSKRVVPKDAPSNKVHPKGKSSISLKARIFELAAAVSSGAVVPIHWIDGAIMTHMINSFNDLQGIHDAVIPTLKDLHKVSKEYNKQAYLIGKNYNLFEYIVDRLDYLFKDADINMRLPNIHNKNNIIPDVEYITLGDFMNAIRDMSAEINIARNAFYSNPNIVISNMSGIEGSYFKASELNNELDTAIKNNTRYGSDPYSYTTDAEYVTLTEASLTDTKVRLEILERLNSMEAVENNEEYMSYLKNLLGSIDSRHLNDITVGINKYTARNSGYFDSKDKEINIDIVTDKRIPISYMDKSAVEIYAHEIIHAIIDPALSNPKVYGTAKTIRQLLNLQRLAMEHITVEDLIPKGYENDKASINRAKDLWDYMFNNEDTTNLRGLKEFIIHGLTNKVVMDKLKDVVVIEEKTETKFIDKLVSLFKGLVSLLTGKESFSKAFPRIASAMIGEIPVTSTDRNVLEGLRRMLDDLATADAKAVGKLTYPFKPVEKLFQSTGELINKGNKLISPYLNDLITLADKIGYKTPVKEIAETKLDQVKWLAKVIPALLFSQRAREAVPIILKILGFKHSDLVQTVIRDMSEPDLDSQAFEALSLLSRKAEQVASEVKSTVHTELLNSYGVKLNELQKETITKVGLYTDLSALLDDMDYSEIKTLLVDEEALKTKIQALESTLPKKHKNWYIGQSKMLAHYMLTGEGNEALLLNAYSIASGVGLKKRIQAKDDIVKNIDTLITLYSLSMSSKASKNTFANLSDNGNISLLKAHKAFVEESKKLILDSPYHTVKGYTKQLLDNSIEVQVAPEEQSIYMKQNGFEFVHRLADNKLTGKKGIALYKRLYNTNRARNGATFMLAGQHSIGTELSHIVKEDSVIRDEEATGLAIHKHMLKANGIKDKINAELEKGNHDITKLSKISARFVPLLNSRGEIVNYRITMDNEVKERILGQNVDGLEILSRMYSSNVLKISSAEQNKKILEFLVKDMNKNFVTEGLLGINKKQYIRLTPESSDPFVRKAVEMLPQIVRDYIFTKKELYVREDWLLSLFGESDMSIIDTKVLTKASPIIKRGLQLAEEILKAIASIAKINIVIRTPAVLLGNIIANFNYSVMTGNNPLVVLKMQLENAQNIRDYINNKKALSRIQFRQKTGIATDNEVKRINWYKTRLEQNPVHPLMEKGMYQAIIEDLDPDDIGTTNKIYKYMNKKFSKVPEGIKTIAKHLYLAEGTPFFQLMLTATQYSDFVARATEYQLLMAKAPKEAEKVADYEKLVSYKILNAFINYDKPSSAIEQYLNDMGLLMFTKFAKRIQSVIKRTSLDNPLSTALFLASQFTFIDSDDILEQNLLNKNFEVLYHSFYDNLVSAVVPSSVRLLTD